MGLFSKFKNGLKKTKEVMVKQIENVVNSFTKIDEQLFEELEEILIMSDVGYETSTYICNTLRKKVKQNGIVDASEVKTLLKQIIVDILEKDNTINDELEEKSDSDENNIFSNSDDDDNKKIILVIGVNGVGKTTTIGKLANIYKLKDKKVVLGAADTFRAAAIDQLKIWSERVGVPIVMHKEGSDPAAVVYDTVVSAKSKNADIIICDTAGRLHNKKNLMDELGKISRVIKREAADYEIETLLVLDATTGQNALNQAKEFKETAGITGIVLTKLDGTAKGGVVILIKHLLVLDATTGQNALNQAKEFKETAGITGIVLTKLDGTAKGGVVILIKHLLDIPVKYIGVGEQLDDLQEFSAINFANALFDE